MLKNIFEKILIMFMLLIMFIPLGNGFTTSMGEGYSEPFYYGSKQTSQFVLLPKFYYNIDMLNVTTSSNQYLNDNGFILSSPDIDNDPNTIEFVIYDKPNNRIGVSRYTATGLVP